MTPSPSRFALPGWARGLASVRATAVLGASAALAGAGPAAAHDADPPTDRAITQATSASSDPLIGAALTHEREHEATARALRRFARLSPARKRAIRNRLLGRGQSARATRALVEGPSSVVGRWTSGTFAAPDYGVHAVLLRGGRVLLFSMGSGHGVGPGSLGNNGQGALNDGQATIWDPALGQGTGAFTEVDPPPIALDDPQNRPGSSTPRPAPLFCAGQVQLADGRVLIAGGNLEASGGGFGLKILFLFDPNTDTWVREPDMIRNRWYPTLTRLPSGRVAILGGQDEAGKSVASFELYPGDPAGVAGVDAAAPLTGLTTSEPAARRDNGMYPHAMVLPSGRLASSSWGSGPMALFEPTTGRWVTRNQTQLTIAGSYATAFPRPGDQNGTNELIQVGGLQAGAYGVQSITRSAYAIRPEQETAWRPQPALNVARRNSTAVLLPDGTAIAVNGGLDALRFPLTNGALPGNVEQKRVELWDPGSGQWTLGPAAQIPRGYHSIALLLADGRVLSGGDDYVASILDTDRSDGLDSLLEVYSPPYLFRGPRPEIAAAQATGGYGETITVRASGDRPIVRATLVAPGSVTHAIDMNQRVLELPLRDQGDGTFAVSGPTTSAAAPPGDYMLFVLNDLGVPSVASWIRIRPSFPGQGTPTLTPLAEEQVAAQAPASPPGLDRPAVEKRIGAFFRSSAANALAAMKRLDKQCPVPKRARTASARRTADERLRQCRARAIS